ncbi:MAG: glutamate--tRNA ligase [Verrucomicrobiales bacterium]|nr:glutamate--tRNA ligase [Verrucomicrobiales bacterium]
MSQPVRTRFAPSPTGFLHIGGARTALYNWLYARKHGGVFVLRVEDTDAVRSTGESLDIILDGLRWLGLDWDEGPECGGNHGPYFQSERGDIYDAYLQKLQAADLVYEDDGAIRFRVPDKDFTVRDAVCGDVSVNLKVQGARGFDPETKQEIEKNPDLVIRRPNGSYIFHFVNVVDDIEMQISHVIRGEDHLSNTPKHLALFEAFGVEPPQFAHIPLNLNEDGTKMSKRDRGALIHEYVENGFLPEAVNNFMALLGWSPKDDAEIFSIDELIERFSLEAVNKSNSKFTYKKCLWVNAEHLKALSAADLREKAAPFLKTGGISPDDDRIPAALELARERAELLSAIPGVIAPIFADPLEYDDEAVTKVAAKEGVTEVVDVLISALEKVDETAWKADSIKSAIHDAAEANDMKMGAMMQPCRVGTMGSMSGPDLAPAMELIGKEGVLERLSEFRTKLS